MVSCRRHVMSNLDARKKSKCVLIFFTSYWLVITYPTATLYRPLWWTVALRLSASLSLSLSLSLSQSLSFDSNCYYWIKILFQNHEVSDQHLFLADAPPPPTTTTPFSSSSLEAQFETSKKSFLNNRRLNQILPRVNELTKSKTWFSIWARVARKPGARCA